MSGDNIRNLPIDNNEPNKEEIEIVNSIFKNHSNTMGGIFKDFKQSMIVGALFVLLSLPPIDKLLGKMIPMANRSYVTLLVVKFIIFMLFYYFIVNFAFATNN